MISHEVNQWLESANLPPTLERELNEEGVWCAELSGAVLTLSVDEQREEILMSVALARMDGACPSAFFHALLSMQLHGELPPGFHFLKEENRLYLVGRQRADELDAVLFNRLLETTFTLLLTLPAKLRMLMKAVRDPDRGRRASDLRRSDEALLERRLSESIRI